MHIGVVTASKPGGKPCLCGEPIAVGQLIVKRWNTWIHEACYDALREAKTSAR